MLNEEYYMSSKEVSRLEVMKLLEKKSINQIDAGILLKLSSRQIRRLYKSYKDSGNHGLISKKRGKSSNNKFSKEFKEKVLELINKDYSNFGPTLASEKLLERDGIKISKESVRKLMIEDGVWKSKVKKQSRVYQMRERRARTGELIQADGSPHDWFEGRRGKCTLIVFIDDATSEVMKLKFYETETTQAYAETLREYIHEFGRMRALYTDRHSIFKVNYKDSQNGIKETQFGRILNDLGIELITANTPQAKGRVERMNQTLQDRLVKELTLRNISTIEEANEFLDDEFREMINNKFEVVAKDPKDMHRELEHNPEEEERIFSVQSERQISKSLEVHHKNVIYQLKTEKKYSLRLKKVLVCESFDGKSVKLFYDKDGKQEEIKYEKFIRAKKVSESISSKEVNSMVDYVIMEQEQEEKKSV